jgi:ribonuclease P protein component
MAWHPTESGHPRVAIVVPRYRQTAVARNRLRRRLREITRRRVLGSLGSLDIVIRARPAAYRAGFAELSSELETLAPCA